MTPQRPTFLPSVRAARASRDVSRATRATWRARHVGSGVGTVLYALLTGVEYVDQMGYDLQHTVGDRRRQTIERVLLYHASATGGAAQPLVRKKLIEALSTGLEDQPPVLSRDALACVEFVEWLMHPIADERAPVRRGRDVAEMRPRCGRDAAEIAAGVLTRPRSRAQSARVALKHQFVLEDTPIVKIQRGLSGERPPEMRSRHVCPLSPDPPPPTFTTARYSYNRRDPHTFVIDKLPTGDTEAKAAKKKARQHHPRVTPLLNRPRVTPLLSRPRVTPLLSRPRVTVSRSGVQAPISHRHVVDAPVRAALRGVRLARRYVGRK